MTATDTPTALPHSKRRQTPVRGRAALRLGGPRQQRPRRPRAAGRLNASDSEPVNSAVGRASSTSPWLAERGGQKYKPKTSRVKGFGRARGRSFGAARLLPSKVNSPRSRRGRLFLFR